MNRPFKCAFMIMAILETDVSYVYDHNKGLV